MACRDSGYILVAALDFGTTFSGYAFSFVDDPEKIISNNNWGEELGFKSHKTPTSVLTNGAGEFITMGYRAEQKYTEDVEEKGRAADLHLYRHFKMLLQKSKDVSLRAVVTSEDGTIRPAVDIFGYAIGFLRQHILESIKDKTVTIRGRPNGLPKKYVDKEEKGGSAPMRMHCTDLREIRTKALPDASSILWVITVPAIWSEPSKKFMREAAKRGGCISDVRAKNLILALEPEAASLCCRRPTIAGYRSEEGISFPPDTKYLVLDCGGGTVDITAHQTLKDDKIEEILPASGGPWGGMYVDRQFSNLLEDIFGKGFINRYKSAHPQSWLQLISSFETTKKPFDAIDHTSLRIGMPWSFGDFHSESKGGKTPKDSIREYGNSEVSFINGAVVLKNNTAKGLFSQILKQITTHVKVLLRDPRLAHCRYLFMVGGFSESKLLQNEVKNHFGTNGTRILIPSEAQLAVLKGAVLFGHYPTEITGRIARKSYGYRISTRFNPDIHDSSRKYTDDDGDILCRGLFEVLVKQGEIVPVGKEITVATYAKQNSSITSTFLYCIDGQPCHPVQYIDLPEAELLGKVSLDIQPSSDRDQRQINDVYTFGSTEIHVRSVHVATGKENTAFINFLSDPSLC